MTAEQRNSVEHHKFCDHCGRALTIEESLTYYTNDNNSHLCEYCAKFLNNAEVDKQKINIVIWALHASDLFNYPWV